MKTIKTLGISALAMLALTACDDALDFYPEITTNEANTMTKKEFYAFEVNTWYSWFPKLMDQGDLQGLASRDGDCDLSTSLDGAISASQMSQPEKNNRYNNYYSHLRSINYLEYYAKKYYEGDQKDLDEYRAMARFFRAYESWIFFRDFGPGTIVKEILEPSSEEVMAPRASRDEFVDFMIEDLQYAINSGYLPVESKIRNSADEGKITISAANALLGRICLFEGTWQKYHTEMDSYPAELNPTTAASRADRSAYLLGIAKDALKKVIDDGSYELFHNDALGQASYKYMFTLENKAARNPAGVKKSANHEYILTNRFDETAKIANQNWVHTYKGFGISRHLVESFETKDGSPVSTDYSDPHYWCNGNMDPRISELGVAFMDYSWAYSCKRESYEEIGTPTVNSIISFVAGVSKWSVETTCGANDASYDIPVIRLGGVYLDYAEVLCELAGGNSLAVGENEHINLLRKRAHMPTKNTWTLDEIRKERACELYLEGYRVDDIRRWAKGEELLGCNLEGLYIGKTDAERKNIFIASPCYTVTVKNLTWDILNTYRWTKLESGDKWLYVFCDPNNKPTYDQAAAKKNAEGKSSFFTSADPTKTIRDGLEISSDGYYVLEKKENRKFEMRTYMNPLPVDQMVLNPNLVQNPFWNN
ncbi:MAG: RagB/SusD family nutrient uptake outer membrane protein [Muribaculaceae bacterium]|nr:RagB/SusD family nutrient uptake outer membrane protein [Muribaculaceae bacterium]